jgi:hypothetical protein
MIPFSSQLGQSQIQQQILYLPYPLLFGASRTIS